MTSTIRGLRAALNQSGRFKFKEPELSADHVVIGGGVVGLAIARELCRRFPTKSTYLIERHPTAGQEISSRNSEVIHSGLYYPQNSLKTRLCLRGRDMLYAHCQELGVNHKQVGKLVVAHHDQRDYIEGLHSKARQLKWPPHSGVSNGLVLPTELISGDEARAMIPGISKDIVAALWCPKTGIVDSHGLMESLETDIIDSEAGQLVYSTQVVRVDPAKSTNGWVIQTLTEGFSDSDSMQAETVINAAGLSAPLVLNSILPEPQRLPMYFARGSYASYQPQGAHKIPHLIYPCPDTRKENLHAFQSLGTHLTLDLHGKVRFGPDIEWLTPRSEDDGAEVDPNFWQKHLIPDDSRLDEMQRAVAHYLPGVTVDELSADYVGIRPKLVPPSGGFQDFVFRVEGVKSHPMVSLLGMESPGLTASLAIAEYVVKDVLNC